MDVGEFNELNGAGESQVFERKVQGQWKNGLKAICGMVNAHDAKGVVACNVNPDGTIEELNGDPDDLQLKRSAHIRAKFDPEIVHRWRLIDHPDGVVLVLEAERAPGVSVHSYDGRTFLRQGSSSKTLTLDEALGLKKQRETGPVQGPTLCLDCKSFSMASNTTANVTLTENGPVVEYTPDVCGQCGGHLIAAKLG